MINQWVAFSEWVAANPATLHGDGKHASEDFKFPVNTDNRERRLIGDLRSLAVNHYPSPSTCLGAESGGFEASKIAVSEIPDSFAWAKVVNFFFQAEDGIRAVAVTGVQTCALPI